MQTPCRKRVDLASQVNTCLGAAAENLSVQSSIIAVWHFSYSGAVWSSHVYLLTFCFCFCFVIMAEARRTPCAVVLLTSFVTGDLSLVTSSVLQFRNNEQLNRPVNSPASVRHAGNKRILIRSSAHPPAARFQL